MNMKALERCFIEKIDKEMSNIADAVTERIQNAVLTAIDSIVAHKIDVASRSVNSSSQGDVTSSTANLKMGSR